MSIVARAAGRHLAAACCRGRARGAAVVGGMRRDPFFGGRAQLSARWDRGCGAVAAQAEGSFRSFASAATEGEKKAEGDDDKPAAEGVGVGVGEGVGEGEGGEPTVDELKALLAGKDELLAQKDAELAAMKDKSLRILADMENLRERTARQTEQSQKFAIQGFAKDLLDPVDNLERAGAALPEDYASKGGEEAVKLLASYHEGVMMTEKQLINVLKKNGVERMSPEGEVFDPNFHQSLFEVPDPSKEVGTVAVVTKAGYSIHGRCLRAADVGVVRAA
mmetsp:Transcript_44558/g.141877  ORF Transcript_44558/g.141877 Transcript_44558/m.141877 type:complete len:277 (-) Transcript_44558:123-953(-)